MRRRAILFQDKRAELSQFCEMNHIHSLHLFGSYLHGTSSAESDIDLLVEFEKGVPVGLFDLTRMQLDLSQIAGGDVDLRTAAELSPYFRAQVMAEAKALYVR